MWKAYERYRQLDPEARKQFWRAVILLALVSLSLRTRGFQRTRSDLEKKLAAEAAEADLSSVNGEALQRTCRMVKAAARHGLGHPSCLEQSLVLWYLLRKQKIPARFRIGVKKRPEEFEAHAWVESDGVALNQSSEAHRHYAAFEGELSRLSGEDA